MYVYIYISLSGREKTPMNKTTHKRLLYGSVPGITWDDPKIFWEFGIMGLFFPKEGPHKQ